jgi:RNA polymerase sigma-70 factor, ECF subfamily
VTIENASCRRAAAARDFIQSTESFCDLADAELVRLVASGDRTALGALFVRFREKVFRFAFQMSGDVMLSEDITQETFIVLIRSAAKYRSTARVSTYLYGVVRNVTLKRLHRERRIVRIADRIRHVFRSDAPPEQEALIEATTRRERIERVRRAVLSLPPRYREIVVLCDLHGHDYEEAAAVIGCPVGTVRSRLHRGRHLLRGKLARVGVGADI